MKYKIVILRDDLEIHYCDFVTLDTINVIRFKTIEELEKYLYSNKS